MKKTFLTLIISIISIISFGQKNGEKLFNFVSKNETENAIKLISENADVNFIKESGWVKVNTLITAINNDNLEIVKLLLEHKAAVNWRDGFNTTALMYAASKGNKEIVEILLIHGADINASDGQGNTVLSAAKESKNKELISLIELKIKQ